MWSPEFVDENRPGRTVVAPWQEYWHDDQFGKRGQAWAPEVHYFRGRWYIVACMGDHSQKVGSFLLVSEGGVEGPYRLVEGNLDKPFGDLVIGGPAFIKPGAYHHIDGSLYAEGDDAWLVLHNNLYAKFRDDMEDIVPTTSLPTFQQTPVHAGAVSRRRVRVQVRRASTTSSTPRGTAPRPTPTAAPATPTTRPAPAARSTSTTRSSRSRTASRARTPQRWTAGVGAGHNNFFADHRGHLWATFFRNPAFGYWSDPSRVADAAVPGVVRLEWTGPEGQPPLRPAPVTPRTTTLAGLSAALVATALWGFTFLGPAAVDPVNIYYLVLGRYTVFGLMSVAVLASRRGRLRALGVRGVLTAMHLGVVGYIGFYLLLSMSASVGGGVLASTMTGLIPLMVSLISNAIEKVFPWHRCLLPIGVISIGLFLVNGGVGAFRAGSDGSGQLSAAGLGFAACLAWSYFVIANRIAMRRRASVLDNSTWTACIGIGAFGGSLTLLPLAASAGGTSPFADPGTLGAFLSWCAAFAVLGSWCATWFWNIASQRLPSTVMGPIIGMEAVFGAFFYLLWEQRMPAPYEVWGAVLVVGGVFVSFAVFGRSRVTHGPAAAGDEAATARERAGPPATRG